MIPLPSFITSRLWQLTTIGASVVALYLGFQLLGARGDIRDLQKANAALDAQINHPVTGLGPQLGRCQANRETLQKNLERQNGEIAAKSSLDAEKLAATEKALSAARSQVARLQDRAADTLAYRPAGGDVCARMEDVRKHYVEGLR